MTVTWGTLRPPGRRGGPPHGCGALIVRVGPGHGVGCRISAGRHDLARQGVQRHVDDLLLAAYLTSPAAAPALVTPGRLGGLRLAATDTDWRGGSGELVSGPIEALAMAAAGRPAALADLHGPGVELFARRLGTG